MVWRKCHPQQYHRKLYQHLVNQYRRGSVYLRDCYTFCWSRRDHRHQRNNRTNHYHYLLVSLLAVSPAYANEEPRVSNTSSPVAAATGNVTNQAVQFQNTGAPSRQYFNSGNSCNGATMTFSPFYMGADVKPKSYTHTDNYGAQLNFSVPLDGGMVELCKKIAKRQEEKLRLDYELVRALKCTEIMKSGFMFRPGSRVEVLCHDIIPIASYEKESN